MHACRSTLEDPTEQYHERIWSLFQRLESQDEIEGTGVGLALVKKSVEGQGGRVWVESQPGHGATFRFLWPVAPVASAPPPSGQRDSVVGSNR